MTFVNFPCLELGCSGETRSYCIQKPTMHGLLLEEATKTLCTKRTIADKMD